MGPILFLILIATTTAAPSRGGGISTDTFREPAHATTDDELLSDLRVNDVLLARSYLIAARHANQNPENLPAQLKAARYAFAVLHVADASRHNDLSKSLHRFGTRALALDPGSAEGRIWVGVGLGQVAMVNGFFNLPQVRERYEEILHRSIAQDADCLSGLAQLHLARMYSQPAAPFGVAQAKGADALLQEVKQRFPTNPLPAVYQAELRFLSGQPAAGMDLLARVKSVTPATPFEGLMKLATSVESEDTDTRLLAWLD